MAKKHTTQHPDKTGEIIPEEVLATPTEATAEVGEVVQTGAASTEIVDDQTDVIHKELEEARTKAGEYLDGWQRSRAEFANYKKRVDREQAQAYQNAAGNIIKRYLDVVDDLDRALKNQPKDGDGAAWANGIELVYRKLMLVLENEGVKPIGAPGEEFDPNLHEAIASGESSQYQSGQIIDVLQQGYMLGERVLRPARVRVSR
jgi:molecular chaperone GrpE